MAEAARTMLGQQLKSASQYVEMLNNTMDDMSESQQKLRQAEVDCVMQLRGEQAVKSLQAQLRAWHRYMGKEKEFLEEQAEQRTPYMTDEQRKQSARSKLATMGARPALGSFSMNEAELAQHRKGLTATASPAAQDIARLRSGSVSPAGLSPIETGVHAQGRGSPLWKEGQNGLRSPASQSSGRRQEDIAISS